MRNLIFSCQTQIEQVKFLTQERFLQSGVEFATSIMFLKYLNCAFCNDSTSDFFKVDHVLQLNISLGRNTDIYNKSIALN